MPPTAQGNTDELAAILSVPWPALVVTCREQIAYWESGIAAEILQGFTKVSDRSIEKNLRDLWG